MNSMAKTQTAKPQTQSPPLPKPVYQKPANRPVNQKLIGEVQKGQRPTTKNR
jgi:hypothetical protein